MSMALKIVYQRGTEGTRAMIGGRVVAVIYPPLRAGGDYWFRNDLTGVMHKGFDGDSVRQALKADLERHLAVRGAAQSPLSQTASGVPGSRLKARGRSRPPVIGEDAIWMRAATGVIGAGARPGRRKAQRERAQKPTVNCPICNSAIRKIRRHFNKSHPSEIHLVPGLQAQLAGGPKKAPAKPVKPKTPISEAGAEKRPASGATTPKWVDDLVAKHVVSLAGDMWIKCPRCSTKVRERELRTHLVRVHVGKLGQSQKPKGSPARPANSAEMYPDVQERRQDATRDFSHTFRERGRFGSHPLHDGYGEEDRP